MRRTGAALAVVLAAGVVPAASGAPRDEHLRFPIQAALEKSQSYRTKLDYDVRLYFGTEKAPLGAKQMATFSANTKSSAVGKSDQEACDIAFLSALARLQERARREGGDAVIRIKSTYRGSNLDSPTDYICGAGNIMVGVTLEGTVVKLK